MSWVRWFWQDYDGAIKAFTDAEVGQYQRLLHLQLDSGPQQAISRQDAQAVCTGKISQRVFAKFQEVRGGWLTNERLASEWARAFSEYEGKSRGGGVLPNKADPALRAKKARAHGQVGQAVRSGRLKRRPCEVCGGEPTIAHHEDYDAPLDVRWLCRKHHSQAHAAPSGPRGCSPDTRPLSRPDISPKPEPEPETATTGGGLNDSITELLRKVSSAKGEDVLETVTRVSRWKGHSLVPANWPNASLGRRQHMLADLRTELAQLQSEKQSGLPSYVEGK